MLRRYWGIGLAFVVAASALHGQADKAGNPSGSKAHAEQTDQASKSKTTPKTNLSTSIDNLAREIGEASEAEAEPYGDERNEREKRDVIAQEEMAKWARLMFYTSAASAALALLALCAVGIDIRLNRRRARIDQRPWLTFTIKITGPFIVTPNGITFEFELTIKNVGSTPARNVLYKGKLFNSLRVGDSPNDFIDDQYEDAKNTEKIGFILAPNESVKKPFSTLLDRAEVGILPEKNGSSLWPVAAFSVCYRATSDEKLLGQTGKGFIVGNAPDWRSAIGDDQWVFKLADTSGKHLLDVKNTKIIDANEIGIAK